MPMLLRPMQPHDLDRVLVIQEDAFGPVLAEPRSVFADKLDYHPAGCWVAVLHDQIAAYLLSHPAHLGRPPVLNSLLDRASSQFDCYFIHDLAVHSTARGTGLATRLAETAIAQARELGYEVISLVAIQGAQGFWERFGFVPAEVSKHLEQKLRQSYGGGARYMLRREPT